MTQLNAKTKQIEEIFQQEYVIPEYQRRYSWEKEHCIQLMDDLQVFHESVGKADNDQYFLGCIVVANRGKNTWDVIDGQQRLMTISLLIRALLDKIVNYADLKRCLQKTDPKTGDFKEELHITSKVIDQDNENLRDILLGKNPGVDSRFSENYSCLQQEIEARIPDKKLDKFIETLLTKAVLLPIECDSVETALTIFQTLNNRGEPLTDADIFKADLYGNSRGKEDQFIKNWNNLQKLVEDRNSHIDQYFRIYMHILRAKENDYTKEIKLRTYFNKKSKRLSNPSEVMRCLNKCQSAYIWDSSDVTTIWWEILEAYPNIYWQYPLYVFLNKHGKYKGRDFSISNQKEEKFISLLKETVRYCYIKGVVTNSVNTIRDTIFKVCADIEHGRNYKTTYLKNSADDRGTFEQKLKSSDYGRYQRGLVVLGSALHPSQDDPKNQTAYANMLTGKCDIEHILPRAWNDYDGWTDESHEQDIDKLGNLIPLEKKLNIRASNEFFSRKKEKGYKDSKNSEFKKLCKLKKWKPKNLQNRHKDVLKRFENFFFDD